MLPGGAARGAYQVGVLRAIADLLPGQTCPFPILMGASVGAINAVVLASHARDFQRGVDQLVSFWSTLCTRDIYRTDLAAVLGCGLHWVLAMTPLAGLGIPAPRHLLDNAPLRALIRRSLEFDRIEDAIASGDLHAIGVTASSYGQARAVTFFQGVGRLEPWQRVRREGRPARIGVEHLMAPTALPLVFDAERIGDDHYGDGSLRLVSPLSPAIHAGADRVLAIGGP